MDDHGGLFVCLGLVAVFWDLRAGLDGHVRHSPARASAAVLWACGTGTVRFGDAVAPAFGVH